MRSPPWPQASGGRHGLQLAYGFQFPISPTIITISWIEERWTSALRSRVTFSFTSHGVGSFASRNCAFSGVLSPPFALAVTLLRVLVWTTHVFNFMCAICSCEHAMGPQQRVLTGRNHSCIRWGD